MKDFFNRPWVYRVIALGLTILLFYFVQVNNLGVTNSSHSQEQAAVAKTSQTMKTDLQVRSDTSKYYVTGYPEKVTVTISGSKSLVSSTYNSQSFQAYIDLRDLKVGTHTVKVKIAGLNSALSSSIKPDKVTVKIQNRSDKTFPIQVKYNSSRVADGYLIGTPEISPETVRVSGSRAEVSRVKQVVAKLELKAGQKSTYEQEALLQALDKNGDTVDVLLTPQTAHVELPVYLPSKKVNLRFKQTGTPVSGRTYIFTSSVEEVTVSAPQSVLDDLDDTLTVPVKVTSVGSSTQKTITLTKPDGVVKIDPASISVNIQVTQRNSNNSSSSSSTSSRTSSSSSTSSETSSSESSSSSKSKSSSQSKSDSASRGQNDTAEVS